MARSWGELPPRYFVATTIDVGFVYLRPRVSVGYGRPFTEWIGIDANPLATSAGVGAYAGVKFALPFVDLRVGPRYFYAFNHSVLPIKDTYDRLDLETYTGKSAATLTYEAELDASMPLGPGSVLARGSVSYVTGVDENHAVFEETLRAIVVPPLVWRGRGGYAFRFGAYGQHSIGVVADVLDIPRRDDSITVRSDRGALRPRAGCYSVGACAPGRSKKIVELSCPFGSSSTGTKNISPFQNRCSRLIICVSNSCCP